MVLPLSGFFNDRISLFSLLEKQKTIASSSFISAIYTAPYRLWSRLYSPLDILVSRTPINSPNSYKHGADRRTHADNTRNRKKAREHRKLLSSLDIRDLERESKKGRKRGAAAAFYPIIFTRGSRGFQDAGSNPNALLDSFPALASRFTAPAI